VEHGSKDLAAIGLGSNLGDRENTLDRAFFELSRIPGVELLAKSNLYETEPVDLPEQPYFLNAAALLSYSGSAQELLQGLLNLESHFGRVRLREKGERTLDLDLLFLGNQIHREPTLFLPHPRLHLRRFVLVPLAEIAPNWVHPIEKKSVSELLAACPDTASVVRYAPKQSEL